METRLEAMEQQVFKCQEMVGGGLNVNHMTITEFTSKHRIDANDIGKHLSRLYDRIDQLQRQIYDLRNQNCKGLTKSALKWVHESHNERGSPLSIYRSVTGSKCLVRPPDLHQGGIDRYPGVLTPGICAGA
ncbi:40s ribosomal protein s5-1 [Hordeum vulgare]|nr:40s ribosomal protein s5-1 [Hordeum vulgare]